MRPAAEAVEVVAVEFETRRPVRVERTAHEAVLDRAVAFRRLDGRHCLFDFVVVDSLLPPVISREEKSSHLYGQLDIKITPIFVLFTKSLLPESQLAILLV